ncbi:MAG: hypothetical protein WCT20_01205 [Candidatus Babeliales bacterium]
MKSIFSQMAVLIFSLFQSLTLYAAQPNWGICNEQECATYSKKLSLKIAAIAPITCDISFLIADIKYTDGQLKICEFGEGNDSRFEGHDFMYGKGTIWSNFWNYIKPFGMPIWYVGPKLYEKPRGHDYSDTSEICYPDFLAAKGRHIFSAKYLKDDPLFKRLARNYCHATTDLATAQGLFIFRHNNSSSESFQSIHKLNKRLLIMDSVTAPFVNNKYFTNILFDDPELKHFKPGFLLCKKKYNEHLAELIKKALPCPRYVIKPLEEFKGRGVMIIDEKDLDATLYKILYINGVLHRNEKAHSKYECSGHWKRDTSPYFLIEEYCPSKTVRLNDKSYDPTMRVAFVLTYNKGEIKTHYLGAYWKIPLFSLEDNVKLTKKHKSWGLNPAEVSPDDLAKVEQLLDTCLPKLYAKMIAMINTPR